MCRSLSLGQIVGGLGILLLAVATNPVTAQDTTDYFRQNCQSCHTIGGGSLTGPDLQDVTQRQDRDWLANFILNPTAVLASGDAYAQRIFEQSRRVPMPVGPNMTRERAEKLLDLIEAESALEESQFRGLQLSTEPFTAADVAAGRDLFLGRTALEAGGAACHACHGLHGISGLGGGQLGPDLTGVYDRLQGRQALGAWLMAPSTPTMQPIFRDRPLTSEEIHALVAYLESTSRQTPPDPAPSQVIFLLLGLGGAAGLMFAFDAVWKWRFRGVRRPLVDSAKARGAR